ncbi:hypothetical protein PN499_22080 [Kamptonema animale CS-326]|jgi:hypothetical protein|uniref:hypothetical protein n=1 Tax=Kamptonema animale TaxID=92934 RepID=UPI002331446A|nr:hypothetical protein [Kamptonema animale]MDB9513892.1 hypothetical protein [Kamptonema animale CS-326]
MNCPKCQNPNTYRKHPHDLIVWCDRCGHSWSTNQTQTPILKESFWLSKPIKGTHHVEVWLSARNSEKFGYRTAYQNSLFGDLKGEFDTAQQALKAAISEVKYG